MITRNMDEQIPAKKNLGNRKLISEVIPQGVKEIGDWAYAHCANLEKIAIPSSVERLGKDVFLGCSELKKVYLYDGDVFCEGTLPKAADDTVSLCAVLNAIAVRFFSSASEVMISGREVTADMLRRWDERCLEFLELPDDTGFTPFLAGGEEDYSECEDQLTKYRQKRQLNRAYVMFTRLITENISQLPFEGQNRKKLTEIFRSCPGALPLLNEIEEHYTETAELYKDIGLVTAETLTEVFDLLDPEKIELRSALINSGSMEMIGGLTL